MKVFISQPMMNRSNEILMRERSKVKQELISEGHEVVDSLFTLPEGKNTPLHYLAKSIEVNVLFINGLMRKNSTIAL